MKNAVDYFIFLNLLHAWDNRGKNVYMSKYKAGEPYFYVPWDLDGIFGIHWDGKNENNVDESLSNGMFDRLMQNAPDGKSVFKKKLKQKWNLLRSDWVTTAGIMALFQANYDYLFSNGAYSRESKVWSYTHNPERLDYLSNWIEHRLGYLDSRFNAYSESTNIIDISAVSEAITAKIYNLNGVLLKTAILPSDKVSTLSTGLEKGIYLIRIQRSDSFEVQKLIVK